MSPDTPGRVNARQFLLDADCHLASVAVPYALATHEEFVMNTLSLLTAHGRTLVTHGKQVRAWNMHTVLFETLGVPEPEEWMQSFHVLRELRNCITHVGGNVSTRLRDEIAPRWARPLDQADSPPVDGVERRGPLPIELHRHVPGRESNPGLPSSVGVLGREPTEPALGDPSYQYSSRI